MTNGWDILGIGVVTVDDFLYVDRFPRSNTKQRLLDKQRQGGGLTATALVAAARLGARPAFVAVLGDDELSRFALDELEREGVDCSPVLRREGAHPIHAVIIVDRSTGERTILYTMDGHTPVAPDEVSADLIARARVLFLDSTSAAGGVRALELAQRQGIPVVADVEQEGAPGMAELLPRVDHLIVGLEVAGRVTGASEPEAMVRALASPTRACAVVTGGERGCWYAERDGVVHHVPAYRVAVVDTTGCGDVFHGAYAAGIARGEPIAQVIRVATATAGLKATRPGGRSGIPSRAAVEAFLATQASASLRS